jgi:pilus assembly protein CpaB
MRMVFGLVLIVGLGLAGFAVYMVQGYLSQTEQALAAERAAREKAGPMVEVYVVNKPLAFNSPLTPEDVQPVLMQESALPETIFKVADAATLFPEGAEPRYILRQFEKFEPLLATKVTAPGEPASLTSSLPKGMQAFAIKVDATSGVSGFVRPGNSVEVRWTGSVGDSGNEITKMIETNLLVIAVDQSSDGGDVSASIADTVTVAATRDQVTRLTQGQATGRLTLSLLGNSPDEVTTADTVEVDTSSLLDIQRVEEVTAEAAEVCYVTEIKRGERIQTEVDCPK